MQSPGKSRSLAFVAFVAFLATVLIAAFGCAKKEAAAPVVEAETAPPAAVPEPLPTIAAVAQLAPRSDMTGGGAVTFSQDGDTVTITAHIEAFPEGAHGFHIHEIGDCSAEDFTSAGGHFNPADVPHGGPSDAERHGGDLGNIEIGGRASGHLELTSNLISLGDGANSIIGRAVILHEKADDLVSQPTGAAGGRIACGVIEGQG